MLMARDWKASVERCITTRIQHQSCSNYRPRWNFGECYQDKSDGRENSV